MYSVTHWADRPPSFASAVLPVNTPIAGQHRHDRWARDGRGGFELPAAGGLCCRLAKRPAQPVSIYIFGEGTGGVAASEPLSGPRRRRSGAGRKHTHRVQA